MTSEDDTHEENVIRRMLSRAKSQNYSSMNRLRSSKPTYQRVIVDGDEGDKDALKCAELLSSIILTRDRYKDIDKGTEEDDITDLSVEGELALSQTDGVFSFTGMKTRGVPWSQYVADIKKVYSAIESGPALSFSRSRLEILEEKFELYSLLNTQLEEDANRWRRGGGVFGQATKVDNSVRLSSLCNAQYFVEYMSRVAQERPNDLLLRDWKTKEAISLAQYFAKHHVEEPTKVTVEGLGLHPPLRKRFHPFDVFDPKTTAGGEFATELLNSFLKITGPDEGKTFAGLVRPIFESHEGEWPHIIASECRFIITGHADDEWARFGQWTRDHGLTSYRNNMWIVQIQRPAENPPAPTPGATFEDQLHNIFYPMFMATLHPHDATYSAIANVLAHTGAMGVVSEEKARLKDFFKEPHPPAKVPWEEVQADYYYFYYIWANLCSLNALRKKLGLNVLAFRPTCGESAPHHDQLVCAFLLADGINHGFRLMDSWVLQYLYLFVRIGIACSPLSNNTLYLSYFENPFPQFFRRGLNVSLSTDEPLLFHHGDEPLIEEYGTAEKIYCLTATDVSEIAYNSVVNSSFSNEMKGEWLGPNYNLGYEGNDILRSNLCDFRLQFRHECLLHEQTVLNMILSQKNRAPIVIGKFKSRRNNVGRDAIQQIRNLRRINYMDRRIVYPRIDIFGGFHREEGSFQKACIPIQKALLLRQKYYAANKQANNFKVEDVFSNKDFQESIWEYNMYYGVFLISRIGRPPPWPSNIPPISHYIQDISVIRDFAVADEEVAALAQHRSQLLEHKYRLHQAMNLSREAGRKEEKERNNRDFYSAHKVDNNVQTDSGMNARTLLDFFQEKALHNGHDVVFERNDTPVTLRELLDELKISVKHLTVDELQYLLSSKPELREIFLSTSNYMGGRYFAELTKRTFDLYKLDAFTFAENRLIVHGKHMNEWEELAQWFDRYGMASSQNRWMISLPRNYRRLKQAKILNNFGEVLMNMFQPLWEVSLHPAQHTKFHYFLTHVSGFDTVDDESKVDGAVSNVAPHDWNTEDNPPYAYYLYYMWANLVSLNEFRASRGLNTFTFRPQCGEVGGVDHLICGFLLAQSVNHGVRLMQYPALQYLFYITQIGIAMSPLSNTTNSIAYLDNPFPKFFHVGLNVSLATNQPLNFHFTQEPLLEEYALAAKVWKLSFNDLSELARNSVLQSGFPDAWKVNALGPLYRLNSSLGNDTLKSRVSDIRLAYRFEVYHTELNYLDELLMLGKVSSVMPRAMKLLEDEVEDYEKSTGRKVEMPTDDDDEPSDVTSAPYLKRQVDELQQELFRIKVQVQQMTSQNYGLAQDIQKMRGKAGDRLLLNASLSVT